MKLLLNILIFGLPLGTLFLLICLNIYVSYRQIKLMRGILIKIGMSKQVVMYILGKPSFQHTDGVSEICVWNMLCIKLGYIYKPIGNRCIKILFNNNLVEFLENENVY